MKYYIKEGRFGVHSAPIPLPKNIRDWWGHWNDDETKIVWDDADLPVCRIVAAPNINDWRLVKRESMRTMGADPYTEWKNPDRKWKHAILKARHSPIRLLNYVVEFDNIPYCYAMHLARHVHVQPYIASQRPDHQMKASVTIDFDKDDYTEFDRLCMPEGTLVHMTLYMNAEALMVMAEKRLCNKASEFTRFMVRTMCTLIEQDEKAYIGLLHPRCIKGEKCIEMHPCDAWRPGKVMNNGN